MENISNKRLYTCEKKDINTNIDVDIDKIIPLLLNSESDNILWEQRKQNTTDRRYSWPNPEPTPINLSTWIHSLDNYYLIKDKHSLCKALAHQVDHGSRGKRGVESQELHGRKNWQTNEITLERAW